jgi:hypothetical protein
MPTPDDARTALRAILNQVPPSMEATHIVLNHVAALGSVSSDEGDIGLEKLRQFTAEWAVTLMECIITLENRIERAQGGRGIPDGLLGDFLSEFGLAARSSSRTISRMRASLSIPLPLSIDQFIHGQEGYVRPSETWALAHSTPSTNATSALRQRASSRIAAVTASTAAAECGSVSPSIIAASSTTLAPAGCRSRSSINTSSRNLRASHSASAA